MMVLEMKLELTCVSYGSPLFYSGINQHSLPFTSEAYELELDLDTSYEFRGYWYLEFTSDCSAHPVCSEVFDQTLSFPQIVPTDGSSWTALKVRFGDWEAGPRALLRPQRRQVDRAADAAVR